MIALQILSKVIATADNSIIEDNLLTSEYFVGYENEYQFIQDHLKEYGNVPDKATFLAKFPDIELVEVTESDRYLVDTAREEYLYYKSVPVIQKAAELLKSDSNAASEYLINAMKDLQPQYRLGGVDIVKDAELRYEQFVERKEHQEDWFFTCGFPELDDLIHGIQRKDELFVIFARTNQGKSWVLEKMCTHIWQIGYNVGYISPEMSASSIGYRFDTLYSNYSNSGLMWGKEDVSNDDYHTYIQKLSKSDNKFIVATPLDFDKKITVTKLKNWIKQYKLDMIAIDGITYMSDERYKRGDNKTTSLTNISEDLMGLSMEMSVPVLVVVQANRTGVVENGMDETPELESIRDSDGIAHNASKILSIHQREHGVLNMTVKKQRMGAVGGKLTYNWSINTGEFQFIPSYDDAESRDVTEKKVEAVRKKFNDKSDVF
jgi:replicative DNA helicase